jgi:hypothetical protein
MRWLAVVALGALLSPWPLSACLACPGCVEQECHQEPTCHAPAAAVEAADCCALMDEPGGDGEALPASRVAAHSAVELVGLSGASAAREQGPIGLSPRRFSPAIDRCSLFSCLLL